MTAKGPDAFRTIGEVADDLDLPQHVLRFWETRFNQIKPMKRGGGRRYYRPQDIELLRGIRVLLYGEGYTIKGVQRLLKERGVKIVMAVGRGEASVDIEGPDAADGAAAPSAATDEQGDTTTAKLFSKLGLKKNSEQSEIGNAPFDTARPEAKGLSEEDVEKLHGTLFELLECKRMLDRVN
jgi:DNA-binding transcriptional MerR regulator